MRTEMIDSALPLIDLHRHLDGSVRLSTILELGKEHGVKLPGATLQELRPHAQVMERQPGVMAFISKMLWMTAVLADTGACRRIARENVEDAKREGIDYIELRFSPWFMAEPHGLDPERVVAAVIEGGTEGAQATGVRVNLIGILSRTYGPDIARKELAALLTQREKIVALDLAGDEANFSPRLFQEHFKRGRDADTPCMPLQPKVVKYESDRQSSFASPPVAEIGVARVVGPRRARFHLAQPDFRQTRGGL